jgi:Endonuclease/Exonuclease/phosphatase family
MRLKLFLSLLVFISLTLNAFSQKDESSNYQILSVAFYNFENLYDTINDPNKDDEEFLPTGAKNYTGKVYLDKLSKIAEVISKLGTDKTPDGPAIIATAEIENINVLYDLVKQPSIASRGYLPILIDGPDKRGNDPALLYNPKYFTPIKTTSLYVPIKRDGDTAYTRDILYVKGLLVNEMVHIFVNHWPSRRGGEDASAPLRAQAASVCREVIDSILDANEESKILVMGDFNDDPMSPSIRKVLRANKDMEDLNVAELYNPFAAYYLEGIGTLAWNDAWNLFDQVIMSHAWINENQKGWFFSKAEVFNKSFLTQKTGNFKGYPFRCYVGNEYTGGYSDHFPVLTYYLKKIIK